MDRLTPAARIGVMSLLTVSSLVAMIAVPTSASSHPIVGHSPQVHEFNASGSSVIGWGLADAGAFVSDGTHLWIRTDCDENPQDGGFATLCHSTLELSASTGALLRIDRNMPIGPFVAYRSNLWVASDGKLYELSSSTGAVEKIFLGNGHLGTASAIVTNGKDVWVADYGDGGLTELRASDGAFLRHIVRGGAEATSAIAIAKSDLLVLNSLPSQLMVLNAGTGALVRVISGPRYHLDAPATLTTDGQNAWITNRAYQVGDAVDDDNMVIEVSIHSGALAKVLRGPEFSEVEQVALDGKYLLVVNSGNPGTSSSNGSLAVLRSSDDSLVRSIGLPSRDTSGPASVVTTSHHVWVDDTYIGAPGIREINPSDGTIIRRVLGSDYDFNAPGPISSNGTDVWVGSGTSVTEMSAANGSLVRVLSGSKYGFSVHSIAADVSHIWVLNANSITELSASTGAFVQSISAPSYGLLGAYAIASDGTDVWVSDATGGPGGTGSVTEISGSTGALVQVLNTPNFGFQEPEAISTDGAHVWVVNAGSSSVTEIDGSTGAFVQLITKAAASFDAPVAIDSDGTHVWVANEGHPTCDCAYHGAVTELSAITGAVIRNIANVTALPKDIASDGSHVWLSNCDCEYGYGWWGNVTELSAVTGEVVPFDNLGIDGPIGIAVGGGRVWVANSAGNSVTAAAAT